MNLKTSEPRRHFLNELSPIDNWDWVKKKISFKNVIKTTEIRNVTGRVK